MGVASIIPELVDRFNLPAAFDYGALPVEVADRQRERAARISGLYRRTVEAAGEIGRELLAAQAEMEHGTFLEWVQAGAGLSKSSAYRCMDMARAFGAKLPTVGSLPLAVVHKLAEKATPEPVRAAVLRRIEAGETIQADRILHEVREAREEAKATAAAEREVARRAALSDERRAAEDALREEEAALRAKGEKGKAARERKEAREREARDVERHQREAEVTDAATVLVDMLGADRAAAYFARFSGVSYQAFQRAEEIAHARRAVAVPQVDVAPNEINRSGSLYDFLRPEDRPRIEALAEQIEREGLAQLPTAVRREHNRLHPIHVLDGHDTVRALIDVLRWKAIPVRLAPPVSIDEMAAIGRTDVSA